MLNPHAMIKRRNKIESAVFITFSGNCKQALNFYQTCFGGCLQFEILNKEIDGFQPPVVSGSLVSDKIIIVGSDLVPDEGRQTGNHMAIYLRCNGALGRKQLIDKLLPDRKRMFTGKADSKLLEITDSFKVRWILGI